jgi:hypothetical protein
MDPSTSTGRGLNTLRNDLLYRNEPDPVKHIRIVKPKQFDPLPQRPTTRFFRPSHQKRSAPSSSSSSIEIIQTEYDHVDDEPVSSKRLPESDPPEEPQAKRSVVETEKEDSFDMEEWIKSIMQTDIYEEMWNRYAEIEKLWLNVRRHIRNIMFENIGRSALVHFRTLCGEFKIFQAFEPFDCCYASLTPKNSTIICKWMPENADQRKKIKDKATSDHQFKMMCADIFDALKKDWSVIQTIYAGYFERAIEPEIVEDFKKLFLALSFYCKNVSN